MFYLWLYLYYFCISLNRSLILKKKKKKKKKRLMGIFFTHNFNVNKCVGARGWVRAAAWDEHGGIRWRWGGHQHRHQAGRHRTLRARYALTDGTHPWLPPHQGGRLCLETVLAGPADQSSNRSLVNQVINLWSIDRWFHYAYMLECSSNDLNI